MKREIKSPYLDAALRKVLTGGLPIPKNASLIAPGSNIPESILTEPVKSPSELGEVFLEQARYNVEQLGTLHFVKSNLRTKEKLVTAEMPLLGMRCQTGCTPAGASDVLVRKAEKIWDPVQTGFTALQCFSDLSKQEFFFLTIGGGDAGNLLRSPEFLRFWNHLLITFSFQELWRVFYFGNETTNPADFTPPPPDGGWIEPTESYFNCGYGLWYRLLNSTCFRVTIAENTVPGHVLPGGQPAIYLNDLIAGSDPRLSGNPNAVIHMSRSFYSALYRDAVLTSNFTSGAFSPPNANNANYISNATYAGYRIVIRDDWDFIVKTFMDNGTLLYNPHRLIFTTSDNLAVGFDSQGISDILGAPHYDYRDDVVLQRVRTMYDTQIVREEYTSYAY